MIARLLDWTRTLRLRLGLRKLRVTEMRDWGEGATAPSCLSG